MLGRSNLAKINRGAVILGMALAIVVSGCSTVETKNSAVTGVVKNASGEPVAGALVKVRSEDARLMYMVVSQPQGRYSTPVLLPGKYTVQGIGGDFQSDLAGPVEVSSDQPGKMDVVLNAPRKALPPEKKMTNEDYAKLMPEGEGKNLLLTRCIICHTPMKYVPRRWTRVWWTKRVSEMRYYLQANGELQRQFNARTGVQGGPLSNRENGVILDYVVKNFGPETLPLVGTALSDKKMTMADYVQLMPEGEGKSLLLVRCLICHSPSNIVYKRWPLQKWANTVDWMHFLMHEYQMKSDGQTGIQNAGLSDQDREAISNYLGKNFGPDAPPDPQTPPYDTNQHLPRTLLQGAEAKYFVLELDLGSPVMVAAFVLDSDGIVWISERFSSAFGRFDPKTRTYTRIATPEFSEGGFGTVAIDPKGMVWFTSNNGRKSQWFQYDPKAAKVINTYDVPVPAIPGGDILFNTLRFPSDGSVWAVGTAKHLLVKLDPSTRKVTEYPVRNGQHPFGIAIGGDQMLWYAADSDNQIVKVDPKDGKMTPYKLPTPRGDLREMAADAEGNLWVAAPAAGKLTKVDYRTGTATEYSPPTEGYSPVSVVVDPTRNLIWFSGSRVGKIGRFDPRTNSFVEYWLPRADSSVRRPQVDPTSPNRVWWNSSRTGRIGYIEVIE